MYLVETKVKASEIQGLGVFAVNFIPIGTVVWEFDPIVDVMIDPETLKDLPEHAREHIRIHSTTTEDGQYKLSLDHNQYTNHSYDPNLIWYAEGNQFICGRNIEAGEELTKDYTTYSHSRVAKAFASNCNTD